MTETKAQRVIELLAEAEDILDGGKELEDFKSALSIRIVRLELEIRIKAAKLGANLGTDGRRVTPPGPRA